MAIIKREIDKESGTTRFLVSGEVNAKVLLFAVDAYYKKGPTKNIIFDFSEATIKQMLGQDMREILTLAKDNIDKRGEGRTALIFSNKPATDLGKLYVGFAKSMSMPFSYGIFEDMESAKEWIDS